MKIHFILQLLLLFLSILFLSCTDEPSSLGITQIESDFIIVKTFDSSIDTIVQNSNYLKRVVPLGNSDWILVGRYQDIKASTLMKFVFGLPDTLREDVLDDSINVTDAWIDLRNRYVYTDTLAAMNFSVHKVNSLWSPLAFTIDSLPNLDYDVTDISSEFSIDDTSYSFDIDESLVLSWMKNSSDINVEENFGIYLEPTMSSTKVIGFQALTPISSQAAKLTVVIEKPGVYIDTISGFIAADVSLVDAPVPTLPSGIMGVQSGVTIKSRLSFDIDALPLGIVINKAELILTSDTINSIRGSSSNNSLLVYYLRSADSLNSEGSPVFLSLSNNKFSGDITTFVRTWVSRKQNYGLLIQPGNQLNGLDLFALKASDFSENAERPRLRVTYTIKKTL